MGVPERDGGGAAGGSFLLPHLLYFPVDNKTEIQRSIYIFFFKAQIHLKVWRNYSMRISIYRHFPEEAKAIREAVFVKEQGFLDEFDDTDQEAVHLILYDEVELPVATCRIFWNQAMNAYTLGRLAVIKEYRGKNIGSLMLKEAEKTSSLTASVCTSSLPLPAHVPWGSPSTPTPSLPSSESASQNIPQLRSK